MPIVFNTVTNIEKQAFLASLNSFQNAEHFLHFHVSYHYESFHQVELRTQCALTQLVLAPSQDLYLQVQNEMRYSQGSTALLIVQQLSSYGKEP